MGQEKLREHHQVSEGASKKEKVARDAQCTTPEKILATPIAGYVYEHEINMVTCI
jgi:hypothetical protein